MSKLDLSYFRAAFLLFLKTPITAKCQGNKLVTLSDKMFMSWTMLTEMNAAKNLLTAIPDGIGALSKLIRLDLHQNKITLIPPSIKDCSSLAEFYMGNNLLTSIPEDIGMLSNLGILDLHSNQVLLHLFSQILPI
jgi:Leucine-rich repeat (LRR) protein